MKEFRLTEIVRILRGNNSLTASKLAERLGVSRRTILRDLQQLQRRGVPIRTESGPHGGVSILPGWTPPIEELTDSEIVACMLPGGTHMAAELGLSRQLHQARRKMQQRLSPLQNQKVNLLQDRILVAPNGWKQQLRTPPALRESFLAIASNRIIEVHYQIPQKPMSMRRCEPLGLVLANTRWYLIARKTPENQLRTYRVDRIQSITRTEQTFTRDPAEKISELWHNAQQSFAACGAHPVVVQAKPEVVPHVEFCLNMISAEVLQEEIPNSKETLLRANVRSLQSAAGLLAGFGNLVTILEPADLRERICEIARQILKEYGGPSGAV